MVHTLPEGLVWQNTSANKTEPPQRSNQGNQDANVNIHISVRVCASITHTNTERISVWANRLTNSTTAIQQKRQNLKSTIDFSAMHGALTLRECVFFFLPPSISQSQAVQHIIMNTVVVHILQGSFIHIKSPHSVCNLNDMIGVPCIRRENKYCFSIHSVFACFFLSLSLSSFVQMVTRNISYMKSNKPVVKKIHGDHNVCWMRTRTVLCAPYA